MSRLPGITSQKISPSRQPLPSVRTVRKAQTSDLQDTFGVVPPPRPTLASDGGQASRVAAGLALRHARVAQADRVVALISGKVETVTEYLRAANDGPGALERTLDLVRDIELLAKHISSFDCAQDPRVVEALEQLYACWEKLIDVAENAKLAALTERYEELGEGDPVEVTGRALRLAHELLPWTKKLPEGANRFRAIELHKDVMAQVQLQQVRQMWANGSKKSALTAAQILRTNLLERKFALEEKSAGQESLARVRGLLAQQDEFFDRNLHTKLPTPSS